MAAITRRGEIAIGIGAGLLVLAAVCVAVFFAVLTGVRHGAFQNMGRVRPGAAGSAGGQSSVDVAMQAQFPDDYRRIIAAADRQRIAA